MGFSKSVESIPNLWYHNGVVQSDATIRSCAANWLWKATQADQALLGKPEGERYE
jgi:hypothetical protein